MVITFVALFSIASLVAIAVSRTRVPYTIALVIVGLVVGSFNIVEPPALTKEFLFAVFLPGLVFEAAYNIHVRELRDSWRTVTALAVPGVLVAIGITGALTALALRATGIAPAFPWESGIVFAALVSATDPIAVVSLFRKLGVPARLTTLVEAESLFNDGTSIVALTLVLAFVQGESTSLASLALRFLVVVAGGAVVGGAVALLIVRVTKQLNDSMIEITLTVIAAYGSFALAEGLHLSGVIATVTAGLLLGQGTREIAFSEETRRTADAFWQYIAFALNSIVFLLIGFEVRPRMLAASAGAITIGFIMVLLSRLGVVAGVAATMKRTSEAIPGSWTALITWGGLRGALAMVLALALPQDLPERMLLIDMTFGVVIASLVVQGLTIPLMTSRLIVQKPDGATTPQATGDAFQPELPNEAERTAHR